MIKYKISLLFMILFIFITPQIQAKNDFSLEYLYQISISTNYFPAGNGLSLPVICSDLIYEDLVGIPNDNYHNIYCLKTGEIAKSSRYPGSLDDLGLYTNDNIVIYVHKSNNKLIAYKGLKILWEKAFKGDIIAVSLDKKNIYLLTTDKFIIIHMNGKISNTIKNQFTKKSGNISLKNDKNFIYLYNGKELFKIDKKTLELVYKKTYSELFKITAQNKKYLFTNLGNYIIKNTGELLQKEKGFYFAISNNYIVYLDGKKLIAENIDTTKILWEKDIIENMTFKPVIQDDLLYIFLEKLYVIDIKNGDLVWNDKDRNDYIDYVPQINVTDKYVSVFIEKDDPKLRIYRKRTY